MLFYSLDDGINVQEVLTEISNQKTVPNIFVNKVHVGGCDRTFQVMIVITHGPCHCSHCNLTSVRGEYQNSTEAGAQERFPVAPEQLTRLHPFLDIYKLLISMKTDPSSVV